MFFYRGREPIDGQLVQVLSNFRETYGLSVISVSVDGVVILFTFAVTGQAMRWFSLRSRNDMLLALAIVVAWLPLSTDSYGLAGVFMLINSYRLCRATEPVERTGYAVLWAVMVLLMNIHDAGQAVAGLAIALLVVGVCSDIGKQVKRFWPAHFFVLFYTIHLAVLGILAG